MCITVW